MNNTDTHGLFLGVYFLWVYKQQEIKYSLQIKSQAKL